MLFDWTSLVLSIVLATIYSTEGFFLGGWQIGKKNSMKVKKKSKKLYLRHKQQEVWKRKWNICGKIGEKK